MLDYDLPAMLRLLAQVSIALQAGWDILIVARTVIAGAVLEINQYSRDDDPATTKKEQKMKSKQRDPIVDRYITTDIPILDIATHTTSPQKELRKAVRMMQESLLGKRLARDAIKTAENIDQKDSDPELMLLMLTSWAELSVRIDRLSEAEAIIHRAKSVITDTTHPAIRSYVLFAESLIANARGNKNNCEKILREIITFIPEHSPRRKFYIWELALFLAQQGKNIESRNQIKTLTWQCNDNFPMEKITMIQFVNAVESGNIQEASTFLPKIVTNSRLRLDLTRIPLRGYQALIKLMHNSSSGKTPVYPDTTTPNSRPNWSDIIKCLLLKKNEEALQLARINAKSNLNHILGNTFDAFCLIRAELASGNSEAARHLIGIRNNRGNIHYLDDFFVARTEMLENNTRQASIHFSSLLQSIELNKANGRLDFEMQLSNELSHGDIVNLTQAAGRITNKKSKINQKNNITSINTIIPTPKQLQPITGLNTIIGNSKATKEIRDTIQKFANLDAPILITGETGTGKEVVARAIHATSNHRKQPFIPVNCSSITETLLESELFGYERGAFTGANKTTKGLFESAGKGVIFLDEIGDISPRLQVSLLRVLETGEIRGVGSSNTYKTKCRVIAATNANLSQLSQNGQFRQDLMYRLERLLIHLPPLRERSDDILQLSRHFLDIGRKVGTHAAISEDLKKTLKNYSWPGNVRELKNVLERMRLMHSDKLFYNINDLDMKFQIPEQKIKTTSNKQIPTNNNQLPASNLQQPTNNHPPIIIPQQTPLSDDKIETMLTWGRSPIRRQDRLRELFIKYKKLTRSEIIKILNISPNTATKDLKVLCSDNFIKRIEPSASTRSHYFVIIEPLTKLSVGTSIE